jgi:hypothetical protein
VDVTAKSYQNGEWVDWITYLYNNGDQCEDITGGWQKITQSSNSTATIDTSSMSVSAYGSGAKAYIQTKNIIDLSKFDTLYVNVTHWSSGDNSPNRCQITVVAANGTNAAIKNVSSKDVYTVPVDSLDEGYIWISAVSAENHTHKMTVDKIWLE